MLSEEEQLRVASFIDSLKDDVDKGREETDLTPRALLWLATKLKEVNEELKQIYSRTADNLATEVFSDDAIIEVAKNMDFAKFGKNPYKDPKNEISDRFYPR